MKRTERFDSRRAILMALGVCILAITGCRTQSDTATQSGCKESAQSSHQSYHARVDTARVGIKKGFVTMPGLAQRDGLLKKVGAAWRYVWPSRRERDFEGWNIPIDWHQIKDVRMRREGQTAPDVVVSERGCSEPIRDLLWSLHEPVRRSKQELADVPLAEQDSNYNEFKAAQGYPVLVIPQGAFGYESRRNPQRKDLEEYVANGGVAVIFSQPFEENFGLLPVPPGERLLVAGYRQDVSSHGRSVYACAVQNPVLASLSGDVRAVDVDGFFIDIPSSSIVLLRRTCSGMPCYILYPYGKGWIAATTLILPKRQKGSGEMRALFRDLITWAKDPNDEIPVLLPAADSSRPVLRLLLRLRNVSDRAADQVEVLLRTPDRSKTISTLRLPVRLEAGGKTTVPVTVDARKFTQTHGLPGGIYHADYRLRESTAVGEMEIQPIAETESGRFIIRINSKSKSPKRKTVFAAWSNDDQPGKENIDGTVHIVVKDLTGTARHFHIWSNHSQERGKLLADFRLPPDGRRDLQFPMDLSRPGTYHFLLMDPDYGSTSISDFDRKACPGENWRFSAKAIVFVFSKRRD